MDLKQYESKSVTPVDDYQCTLSDDLLEILRKEVRETEEIRNHGIKAMRDWVMQNPRIKRCRLDSIWILKHLRFRKHSIPLAQEAMERHLVIRQGSYGQQYFHLEADILRPCIKALFDDHPVCILRDRDEGGRPIVFIRIPKINPDRECILKDIMTALAAGIDMLSNIEEFHIRGVVYILDVSGWSSKYLKILPIENLQKLAYNSEKCATGRHKGFHIVNVPKALTFFADLGLKLSPQKAKERMRFYKSFDDLKVINRRSLPLEYGGSIPMKVLADEFWEMLVKTRPTFMQNSAMRVAEEMYPKACMEGSVAMLSVPLSSTDLFEKATQCGDDAVFGVQGSFRKMEID